MKRKGKFIIIKYVTASSVKEAAKGDKNILAIIQKDAQVQALSEAIGLDFSPQEWKDDEPDVKLGF